MRVEPSGKPDAWKLARPVWGWGRGATPRPTPRGGAVFVTATDIKYFNAWQFVEQQEKRHGLQKDIARLVDTANKLGLQPEDLDEAVHDAAGGLAASIDNSGLDDQIAWLVNQLGIGDVETYITTIAERKA